ncbi:SpoIIE family protein phosphatase [Micromonospora sp. NPDC004551]|uniref:SpoIIE family protein phosphatase n=1 Tax=Micromonospora sp. NPDC004551 TaxID=3154284 RepID=UPI0033B7CFF0
MSGRVRRLGQLRLDPLTGRGKSASGLGECHPPRAPVEAGDTHLPLQAGAGLLLYTDGVYEDFTEDGTRLGEQRFIELAGKLSIITDLGGQLTALLGEIQCGDDGRHSDDTALLYLTWPPSPTTDQA